MHQTNLFRFYLNLFIATLSLLGNVAVSQQNFGSIVSKNNEYSIDSQNIVSTISVPLKMQGVGFFSISSFSFYIGFDPSKLQFAGVEPVAVSNVSSNVSGNLLSLQWSNPGNPVNMTSNTLVVNILFNRIAIGDVSLIFQPGSKVGGSQGLLPVNYTNTVLLQTWDLSIENVPSNGGTSTGAGNYLPGQLIQLQATPEPGFLFSSWTQNGQNIGSGPNLAFIMPNSHASLQANFTPKSYQVLTHPLPTQGGSTNGSGIYNYGQTVTVQAVPALGYSFSKWTINGVQVSSLPSYSFQMPDSDLDLWANFELINYNLSLNANPPTGGIVTGGGNYHYNQTVVATAIPATGFHFVNWTQGSTIVSDQPNYTFQMPASDYQLTARFLINTYIIDIQTNQDDYGVVSGGGSFTHGSPVSLQAVPNEGYEFVAWTENNQVVSYESNYSFIAEGNRSLTAIFQLFSTCPPPLSLSISELSEYSSTLRWVSAVQISDWKVWWGRALEDTIAGEGVIVEVDTNLLVLDTLSPQTSYIFYVKSYCIENQESEWSEGFSFSTHYVGISQKFHENPWSISPNPGKGVFTLSHPENHVFDGQIQIHDMSGKLMTAESRQIHPENLLDLHFLTPGFYVIKLLAKDKSYSIKLLINK